MIHNIFYSCQFSSCFMSMGDWPLLYIVDEQETKGFNKRITVEGIGQLMTVSWSGDAYS